MSSRGAVQKVMRREAASKLTKEQITEKLFKGADELFNARADMRKVSDILQDAYDDATGLVTKEMYADEEVKKTRDMMYQLDHQIGTVAREMENLARNLKKK